MASSERRNESTRRPDQGARLKAAVGEFPSVRALSEDGRAPRLGWTALGIFGFALAVRAVHLWQIQASPVSHLLWADARNYDEWARTIAAGDWIGKGVFYQAPLYPYFLGVIYKVFNGSLLAARICQAMIGSASCVLLAAAGCRFFSRPAGLRHAGAATAVPSTAPQAGVLAGLILGLYTPAIFYDGLIQKSVLDLFFLCLVLWLLSRMVDEPRPGLWAWAGLATGCLILTRENAAVFVVVILVWLFIRRPAPVRPRLASAGVFLLGLTVVLLPVALRNQLVGGEFHLTTSQLGPNFYIGNNEHADGTYIPLRTGRGDPLCERQDATDLAESAWGRRLTPAEVSHYWVGRALHFIASHPGDWLRLMARKFALTWNAVELVDAEDQYTFAEWSLPLRWAGYVCHFGVLAPLALLGVCLTWPQRGRLWLLYAMLGVYAASVVMFYVFARYRYPLVPFLVLFAAAGLAALRSFLGARSYPRIVGCAAAALIAAGLCNWPMTSKTAMRAATLANISNAFLFRGELEKAVVYARRSLELDRDVPEIHYALGNALAESGKLDEAITYYRQALRMAPDYVDAMTNLGVALTEQGKLDEAIDYFRQALRIDPQRARAMNNMGLALLRQDKLDEAVSCFRRALQADPDDIDAHRYLANGLARQGRVDEAIEHYRSALKLNPQLPDAQLGLGMALSEGGGSEEALAHLREALRMNRDSPVFLTRVAWLLATKPGWDPSTSGEAIGLALRAVELTGDRDAETLDALAAAYAAAGQFDQAVTTAQRALELPPAGKPEWLDSGIRMRMELYRQAKPYRESTPAPATTRPGP